jgi:hypothetical protein
MREILDGIDPIDQSHFVALGKMRQEIERADFFSLVGRIRSAMSQK